VASDRNGDGNTAGEVRDAILRSTEMRTDGAGAGRIDVTKAVDALKNPKGRVPRAVPVGECMRWRYEVVE